MENAFQDALQSNVQSQNQSEISTSSQKKTLIMIMGSFIAGALTAYLILTAGGNSFKGSFINESTTDESTTGPALTLIGQYKDNAISLTWTDTTGEEVIGYRIERADATTGDATITDASQKFKALKVIKSSAPYEYTDTEIQPEKNYLYIVRSFKPDRTEAAVSKEFQIAAGTSACKCSESPEVITSEIFTPEAIPIIPVFTPEPIPALSSETSLESTPEPAIEVSPTAPESVPAAELTPIPASEPTPEPPPAPSRSSR